MLRQIDSKCFCTPMSTGEDSVYKVHVSGSTEYCCLKLLPQQPSPRLDFSVPVVDNCDVHNLDLNDDDPDTGTVLHQIDSKWFTPGVSTGKDSVYKIYVYSIFDCIESDSEYCCLKSLPRQPSPRLIVNDSSVLVIDNPDVHNLDLNDDDPDTGTVLHQIDSKWFTPVSTGKDSVYKVHVFSSTDVIDCCLKLLPRQPSPRLIVPVVGNLDIHDLDLNDDCPDTGTMLRQIDSKCFTPMSAGKDSVYKIYVYPIFDCIESDSKYCCLKSLPRQPSPRLIVNDSSVLVVDNPDVYDLDLKADRPDIVTIFCQIDSKCFTPMSAGKDSVYKVTVTLFGSTDSSKYCCLKLLPRQPSPRFITDDFSVPVVDNPDVHNLDLNDDDPDTGTVLHQIDSKWFTPVSTGKDSVYKVHVFSSTDVIDCCLKLLPRQPSPRLIVPVVGNLDIHDLDLNDDCPDTGTMLRQIDSKCFTPMSAGKDSVYKIYVYPIFDCIESDSKYCCLKSLPRQPSPRLIVNDSSVLVVDNPDVYDLDLKADRPDIVTMFCQIDLKWFAPTSAGKDSVYKVTATLFGSTDSSKYCCLKLPPRQPSPRFITDDFSVPVVDNPDVHDLDLNDDDPDTSMIETLMIGIGRPEINHLLLPMILIPIILLLILLLMPWPEIGGLVIAGILIPLLEIVHLLMMMMTGIYQPEINRLLLPVISIPIIIFLLMPEIGGLMIAGILIQFLMMTEIIHLLMMMMTGICRPEINRLLLLVISIPIILLRVRLLMPEIGNLVIVGILIPLLMMAGIVHLLMMMMMTGIGHRPKSGCLLMLGIILIPYLLMTGIGCLLPGVLISLLLMTVIVFLVVPLALLPMPGIESLVTAMNQIPLFLMPGISRPEIDCNSLPMPVILILLLMRVIDHSGALSLLRINLLLITDLLLMIGESIDDHVKVKYADIINWNRKCHRHFHTLQLRRFCYCGKHSCLTVFEQTCPQSYEAVISHSTVLTTHYSNLSDFLLPADNWWQVKHLIMMLLTLGGQHLYLQLGIISQHSSFATGEKLMMETQTREYTTDGHAEEDALVSNTELQFSSHQLNYDQDHKYMKYSPFINVYDEQKGATTYDPYDLANLVLLLLLIAGDVEVNPGPGSERFRQLVAKLSDKVRTQHLQTQQCIIVSIHATLLPEAKDKLKTLEGLYNGLASSRKYCGHCDRILYCIVDLLSLNVTETELQLLKEQADLQPGAVLNSRDIKFLKLIIFLSYEPKESLISANILPASARGSTKDAAEIISGLIQTGRMAPTSASLKSLLTSVNNNELYKMKIKEVLDAPVWTPAKPATVNLSSSQFSDLVVPDSPQPPADTPPSKSLGGAVPHSSSGWTAPVIKKSDITTTSALGDEPVSSPTIRELAVFPSLGDAWENLGAALSIDEETLKSINEKSSNSVKKQRELFRVYLKSNPNPTWSDIVDALVRIKKQDIARRVIDTFSLSPELLAIAQKSIRPRSSLAKSRVEPDTAELVPARVSKTEVHPSIVVKSHSSGKSFPKSRVESDYGTTLSAEDLSADKATVTPVPKRVSKTDIHSLKKLDHHPFDSSQPQPSKHRLASDGGLEETDNYFPVVERSSESTPSVDDGELKSIPTPFGSDPIKDKDGRSSISGSDRELSFRKESEPSSPKENSPSSEDFHSAEEMMPLDTRTTESDKYQQVVFGSHVSHRSAKRLRDSVLNANIEEIKRSIEESTAVINFILEVDSGHTALHIASKLGSKDVAKVLLQRKASVMVKDIKGCTPLYLAASSGNYEIAKLIIACPGCDMNTVSKDGTPLLYDPASKGFSMICELLLENGTNPRTETRTGMSPLYISSKNGHKDVVRILLKFGADVTRVCMETSKTPLQEAIDNEHVEVTKLLMKALTEVNKKNEKLFKCQTAEKIHELIKHGASVDFRKANGSTPLIVHSLAGNKEVVQALIEEKANVDVQDNDGWSALLIASRVGHIEVVRSLIYAGAIPDLKNKEGLTALMCATLAAHINVIKELLLAKADPMLKRKDGRSAMEIAEQCGNQEIIATLKRHTTSASAGNDPLFGLLGSYLELKKTKKQPTKNGEKAPHDHSMAASLKRRESLSSLLPPLPGAMAKDDTSTVKQELEKCYKRIADLETRIHDLTLQSSIEVPSETDLAHLDERRLRDEYSKLKELKRKAELYAVEAKQTAQRLSAENAKLREDLNKERKYNELTRANIVREFEHKVSHGGEKSAKMDVVEKEIEERAQQFLRRMPQEKGTLKRVELKAVEIKEMIFEKRVTVNCLELAVMGLPGSGKSELFHRILELKIDSTKQSSSLDFHQAVLCHDQYNNSHTWIKSTAEDCSVQPVSTALAKILVCMHPTSSISGYMSGVIDPSNVMDEFSDFRLNQHFKVVLENVQKVAVQLESKGFLDVLKTSSFSIFNLAYYKVGRVAHEVSSALASRSRNRVILNLVNLARYSPENVSLSDGEKPADESNIQQGVMRPESALHKYIINTAYMKRQPRVILIGTHKDKINQGKLKELKKSVEQITQGYAESAGVADAVCPGMECINTKDENDCQRLQNRILELINRKRNFQYEIPISYLFLLSYLQSLQQMFISRKRLTEIAHSCGVTDEDEIEEFLEIFNNCGSIIKSSDDEIPTLRDYIILNPYEFIKTLDKLDSIKTMSFSDKLELFEQVDGTRLGFLSEEMAAYLWPGEGEGRMTQSHFILTVLKEFKAILPSTSLKLEADIGKLGAAGGRVYFMPMLRAEYDKAEIQGDSNSLIITHNNAVLPFRLQTDMLLQIQNQFDSMITFDPKPYYNSICFKLRGSPQDQSEVNIVIHFHTELVEVSVQFPNQPPRMATATRIYSHLKSACVQTFQLLSTQVKELKYDFTFLCPYGKGTPSFSAPGKNSIHFVSFDPLMAGEDKLFCQSCQLHVPAQKLPWPKLLWIQVAYQGPIKDINNPKGYLSNEKITMVCHSLASRLSLDTIETFTKQLKSSKEEPSITTRSPFTGLESLLHFLIFTWKSRNPVNSVESLARILHTCGCYQEAMRLDPIVAATADQESLQLSLSDKEWSTIAAYLPQSVMQKLAESDPKGKVLNREAVSRKVAIRKLMELEYCSLAVALEIGWFS